MSEPEINYYLDEFGSIKCSVTNKGVLLGEDEQKFIVDSFTQLRDENAKMRKLVADMWNGMCSYGHDCRRCAHWEPERSGHVCEYLRRMRELGIEVDK